MVRAETIPFATVDSITIMQANWRDTMAILKLEKVCFPQDAWPVWDVLAVLTFPNTLSIKAVDGSQLVGFIVGDIRRRQKMAWIATFGVDPAYRGKGVGATLLSTCEELLDIPRIRLSVRASNAKAIHLYKKFNYRVVGTWYRYYKGGEDALVMEKELSPQ